MALRAARQALRAARQALRELTETSEAAAGLERERDAALGRAGWAT